MESDALTGRSLIGQRCWLSSSGGITVSHTGPDELLKYTEDTNTAANHNHMNPCVWFVVSHHKLKAPERDRKWTQTRLLKSGCLFD